MKLSVITTLYQSEPFIEEFYKRLIHALKDITQNYEIIMVDDGSSDNSVNIARSICNKDNKVTLIELSRNFGHHKAIMTGLNHATGDLIFLIDSDLEEDPELIKTFLKKFEENKEYDVIYGVQRKRKGNIFEKISGRLFFTLFNLLSNVKVEKNMCTVRLMTRRYVENLLKFKEHELVFFGISALTGFKQKGIYIDKSAKGTTTYSFNRKLDLAINSIVSFSNKLLVYIFYLGTLITILSSFYILYVLFLKLYYGISVTGWASLIISIWFVGGVIIFCLGIIGMYLSKIFTETKNRPYVIIKDIYSTSKKENDKILNKSS